MNAVIVDNAKDQDDEDDLFVVEDNAHTDPYIEEVFRLRYKLAYLINFKRSSMTVETHITIGCRA